MRFFENDSLDPYFNQAYEEYVFRTYREGVNFLVWRNRASVICGAGQCLPAETDLALAARDNIPVLRRATGGGAVYHDPGNVNFAFMADAKGKHIDYGRFLRPVCRALQGLGIDARPAGVSEVMIGAHKISGNAQKIAGGRVWHHGTLLYDADLKQLHRLANGQRGFFTTRAVPSRPVPVTNIAWRMAAPFGDTRAFMQAFVREMARVCGPLDRQTLSAEEKTEVNGLAADKYRSWEWTLAQGPPFTYRRTLSYRGEPLTVSYRAKRGRIESLAFDPAYPEAAAALRGVRIKRSDLTAALAAFPDLEGLAGMLF